ncbi:hypothetical protein [Flavobacterium psychrophilum]|uniref:hypothetical protein n=1 Tax=Flavobacterium psychrophilum TaxID=96345 RepID=UPI0011756728|nr:hypothetical protein [Flavobacterium psychrophilum]GEJ32100.1 hypothetical protein FPN181_contig00013-0072 [Flavobacterium psychrophilum]GEJ37245.1 hypothetical protein FPN182_contig00014-0072 [Flavobacterium psychrophilum]GEJ39165.1 hypothetical protein FPN187_contig00054-0015 [Flavobacterium psychrophilum]GEJ39713.1 hypothetical protein FPN186_contig00031-0015 [Flavobacterium psychrophilum]GEJ41823.1 hypothetical protein FPN185_contig00012-0072 [Flavobacterium psychrophilum]
MTLNHPELVDLIKKAYSAEKAAAFAYQGHAASLKDETEKKEIRQIEIDEWFHRKEVLQIMNDFDISISKYYEFKFHIIGKAISASCHIIRLVYAFLFRWKIRKWQCLRVFQNETIF